MQGMWHKTKARLRVSPKEKNAKKCGDEHVRKGREALQMGWYEFASTLVQGKTVLDVGCGSGEGLELLHVKAEQAVGIDLDERLKRKDINIQFKDVSVIPDKSFDVVICIDVIEHVEDDKEFVKHLVRELHGNSCLFQPLIMRSGETSIPTTYENIPPTSSSACSLDLAASESLEAIRAGKSDEKLETNPCTIF